MGLILDINDFDFGRYKIALDPEQEQDLELYIERVESEYLPKLFGKDLYLLFLADWNAVPVGVPTSARFSIVFNEFVYQDDCVMVTSEGMMEMLKGFVYYLYVRDIVSRPTTIGIEKFIGENVTSVTAIHHDITSRYNEGIDTYKSIQYYMSKFNASDYPEYKGIELRFANIV